MLPFIRRAFIDYFDKSTLEYSFRSWEIFVIYSPFSCRENSYTCAVKLLTTLEITRNKMIPFLN